MSFAEVKVFQVLPDKVDDFEALAAQMTKAQSACPGCHTIRYLKRFYVFDTIQDPPRPLKKVVEVVKYYSFWEFDTLEQYHAATLQYFAQFEKPLRKLMKAPFDIHCGNALGEEQHA
ncbi:MAG: hypothetical protein VB029_07980 [Anaerolineaceae bacterium]|jgi:recombinational DNA repair protein RecR|nr:hypothetical protein [Anaerolineaceae bacterium]HNX46423.1 hypothetical protein [Anaerolineaceae bacterium]HPT23623.1 hypothetical protein [Anaerolineaceae bacterium]